jgi:hypothetical protein
MGLLIGNQSVERAGDLLVATEGPEEWDAEEPLEGAAS